MSVNRRHDKNASRTAQQLQQQLDPELVQRAVEEAADDVVDQDAGDHLEVVQLREEHDEVRALLPARLTLVAWARRRAPGLGPQRVVVPLVEGDDVLHEVGRWGAASAG